MIEEYKIVESDTSHALKAIVSLQIYYGWQPLGGVSVVHGGVRYRYVQAMIKLKEK